MTSLHARLAALEAKATKGPWGKTPTEEKDDVCLWLVDGDWMANVGNWSRFLDGGDLAKREMIETEHDANAALIVATRNALPAIMRIVAAAEGIAEVHATGIGLGPCMCHVCQAVRAASEVTL